MAKGYWKEKNILPPGWVEKSFIMRATNTKHKGTKSGYGYLWWGVVKKKDLLEKGIYSASGLGTQKLYIIPKINSVIVFLKDTSNFKGRKASEFLIGTSKHDQFLSKVLSLNKNYLSL